MSEPSAPKARAKPRWPLVVGGCVLALVVIIGLCEAAGWPFLVGPGQRWLSRSLERQIVVSGDANGNERVRIGLIGSVRLQAPTIEIGAPTWSRAPHMVLAHHARLKLAYGDLWRAYRGGALRISELRADDLDAHVERLADGRASWQFGAPKPAAPEQPSRLPSFGELRVGDGALQYRDEVLQADVDARFALTEGSAVGAASGQGSAASSVLPSAPDRAPSGSSSSAAPSSTSASGGSSTTNRAAANGPAPSGLQLHATGQYRKLPLRIELSTTGVLALAGPDAASVTQPVVMNATIGKARVRFDGTASDPLHLTGLRGRFDVQGASLASVGDPLGVTLPTTGPFKTHGFLAKDGDIWKAKVDEMAIAETRLSGAFTFDHGPGVPLLSGRLNGSRLVLADLGPAVGAQPRAEAAVSAAPAPKSTSAKVLPDRRFDLPALRAMNANVLIDIAYLDLGTPLLEPLRPLRTHLTLSGGVLNLLDLEARTAEGQLSGALQLDGRKPLALWTADLRLLGVRLERWLHQSRGKDAPPYISGFMDAQVKVNGSGRSTAEILGSLGGSIRLHLRQATLSHLAVEAAGIDLAQAVGVFFKGDDSLAINCNVVDLTVDKGVAKPRVVVFDTRDSTIWVTGAISLGSEAMDLTAVVSPKDFSLVTLRTPIHVKGTFANPAVSLESGKIAGKVGAAALLSLLNPLAAVIPFIDTGSSDEAKREAAQCASLTQRSNVSAGVRTAPARR
jgi:uncharacterized protein involved in outer membrane biogenesis